MSQNVPSKAAVARLPIIKKGIVQGKEYTEIAEGCGVTRRTIYRDRQSIAYHELLQEHMDQYLQGLREFRECNDPAVRFAAVRELGLQVRALMRAAVPQKIEATGRVEVIKHVDESELEEYLSILVDMVLEEETRRTLPGPEDEDSQESVDTGQANA